MKQLSLEDLEVKLKKAEEAWQKALDNVKNTPHPHGQSIMDITYLVQDSFNDIKDIESEIRKLKNTVL